MLALRAVLVLQPEALIAWMMCDALEGDGWRAVPVVSLRAALEALEDLPDLAAAVVDYRLPDGLGVDAAAALRRVRPGLPVVLERVFPSSARDAAGIAAKLPPGPLAGFDKLEVDEMLATVRQVTAVPNAAVPALAG